MPAGSPCAPRASRINDLGQCIGRAHDAGGVWRPFLYVPGQGMRNLSTEFTGWSSVSLDGINQQGFITGSGYKNGRWRGWILIPRP
jgi:probable HAF family extracellular repeat protein